MKKIIPLLFISLLTFFRCFSQSSSIDDLILNLTQSLGNKEITSIESLYIPEEAVVESIQKSIPNEGGFNEQMLMLMKANFYKSNIQQLNESFTREQIRVDSFNIQFDNPRYDIIELEEEGDTSKLIDVIIVHEIYKHLYFNCTNYKGNWYLFSPVIRITASDLYDSSTDTEKKDVNYIKEFNWTIKTPKDFVKILPELWYKSQNEKHNKLNHTLNEVHIEDTCLIAFKVNGENYFQAFSTEYSSKSEIDYMDFVSAQNKRNYNDLELESLGYRLDTISSVVTIDGLDFYKHESILSSDNLLIPIHSVKYRRLFNQTELLISIIAVHPDLLKGITESVETSAFH